MEMPASARQFPSEAPRVSRRLVLFVADGWQTLYDTETAPAFAIKVTSPHFDIDRDERNRPSEVPFWRHNN